MSKDFHFAGDDMWPALLVLELVIAREVVANVIRSPLSSSDGRMSLLVGELGLSLYGMALKGAERTPPAAYGDASSDLLALEHCVWCNVFRSARSGSSVPQLLVVLVHVYTRHTLRVGVGDSLDGAMDVSTGFGFGSDSGIDIFRE